MRMLLVHNYYGSSAPSGENQVFEAERAMLERHGMEVDVFMRHSDEIRLVVGGWWLVNGLRKVWGLLKGAVCTVANPFAAMALKKKIREFSPDVVHFHNTFPLISPLAIRTAKKSKVKVVVTLHNYRMVCAAGIPMRRSRVCDTCFRKVKVKGEGERRKLAVISALRNRCYRGSLLATVPLVLNVWLYRKRWAKWVDKFIALSEFQRQVMIECGLPAEKIVVKGNFIQSNNLNNPSNRTMRSGVVFVGRLSDEKGVKTLLKAWRIFERHEQSNTPNNRTVLTLIGDGDQRAEYEKLANGLKVRFLGKLPHDEALKELSLARLLVMPSEWWETFGLVLVEAAMCETPAVVSDLGALPEIVTKLGIGRVFRAGNEEGLAKKIQDAMKEDANALKFNTNEFSEEMNFNRLMEIYK